MSSKKPSRPTTELLKSYRRVHQTQHPRDVEEGKIRREITRHLKAGRRGTELARRLMAGDEDEALDRYEESMQVARKEQGNARTHKRRLKGLLKHEDFQ